MAIAWQDNQTFLKNSCALRQLVSLFVSVIIVLVILMIPIKLMEALVSQQSVIEVRLMTLPSLQTPKVIEEPPELPKKIKENIKLKKIKLKKNTTIKATKQQKKPILRSKPVRKQALRVKTKKNTETRLPKSGVIFESAYGKIKLHKLDESFQARTGKEKDFKFKSVQQPQWNHVTKLLNEEVDKPRLEMEFYSVGVVGSVEKFLDDYVPKKTFTTQYGTKIDCMFVGLVICGWK